MAAAKKGDRVVVRLEKEYRAEVVREYEDGTFGVRLDLGQGADSSRDRFVYDFQVLEVLR